MKQYERVEVARLHVGDVVLACDAFEKKIVVDNNFDFLYTEAFEGDDTFEFGLESMSASRIMHAARFLTKCMFTNKDIQTGGTVMVGDVHECPRGTCVHFVMNDPVGTFLVAYRHGHVIRRVLKFENTL